jgi:hypothetical protein
MASDVGQLVKKINQLAISVENAGLPAVKAAALEMKSYLLAGAAEYAGSDLAMRNVGKKGAKLSCGFDIRGGNKPLAVMKARGPWGLVTVGAKPHNIKPKKRNGLKAVGMPDGNVRNNVPHPGTKGKPVWLKAKEKGTPAVYQIMSKQYINAVRKGFG